MSRETFRKYDIPDGREPESFAYTIEEIWAGMTVDTLYTDSAAELARIVPQSLADQYDVRLTQKDGQVEYIKPDSGIPDSPH